MNVVPLEENFKIGTFKFVFNAKESVAKEGASFTSLVVKDHQVPQLKNSLELLNIIERTNCENSRYGHDTKVKSTEQKHVYPTIFVILKIETSDCSGWCF